MTASAHVMNIRLRLLSIVTVSMAVFVATALVSPPETKSSVTPAKTSEQRYLFDEDFNWITPAKREKFLSDAKTAGFNVIVPVVWRGKGVSWPSSLAPMDPVWSGAGGASTDPLKDLISRAHELGIKVTPWFTVAHRLDKFFPEFHEEGTPDQAFNIHEEGFRRFIVKLMMEVVEKYEVDGINLDYVRAKGVCKTPACRAHYNGQTKRDLLQDAGNMWRHKDAGDAIAQWNAEAVTRIIEDFSAQARAHQPKLPISIDSHPVAKWTYLEGASSIAWVNRGLIDMIFDMQYTREIDVAAVNSAKSKLLDPAKYVLLVGNYEVSPTDKQRVWPRDASLVAELLRKSQLYSQKANAAALYEYRFLNLEQIKAISLGTFNPAGSAALLPAAGGLTSPRLSVR
jgi:uncharacterized lipoprotein YddW (UPF0748 family)